jgi:hypothetical protein
LAYSCEDVVNLKTLNDVEEAKYLDEIYAYANKGH